MNILLIITPYSPAQTPNTLRWIPIIKHWRTVGYSVTVLTTKWRNSVEFEELDGVDIYRTGYNTLLDWFYNKFSISNRRNKVGNNKLKKPNIFKRGIEKLVDVFWRKRYWPDGSVLFLKPGKKLGDKLITAKKITHVISVGLPFTNHLICKSLKVKNPKLFWLMDIQDPFSFSDQFWVNNFDKYAIKNIEEEGKCFETADKITVTNDQAYNLYTDLFEMQKEKLFVIPPLISLQESTPKTHKHYDESKINIAYFGSFYEKVRSPFRFLMMLDFILKKHPQKLANAHFHFFGEQNKFSAPIFHMFKQLVPYITHHGYLRRLELSSHVKHMDMLLNFGNQTNYHLPSKVVEYIYFNKPLINIVTIEDDSSYEFLKGKLEILNLKMSKIDVEKNAELFLDFIEKRDSEFNIKGVQPFLPKSISKQYKDLMV